MKSSAFKVIGVDCVLTNNHVSLPHQLHSAIATQLARLAMTEMIKNGCQEIILETESDNLSALSFYSKLGFLKEKGLFRFYLNAKSAFRLALQVPEGLDLTLNLNLGREEIAEGEGG